MLSAGFDQVGEWPDRCKHPALYTCIGHAASRLVHNSTIGCLTQLATGDPIVLV